MSDAIALSPVIRAKMQIHEFHIRNSIPVTLPAINSPLSVAKSCSPSVNHSFKGKKGQFLPYFQERDGLNRIIRVALSHSQS